MLPAVLTPEGWAAQKPPRCLGGPLALEQSRADAVVSAAEDSIRLRSALAAAQVRAASLLWAASMLWAASLL